jgi:hypothetical protein
MPLPRHFCWTRFGTEAGQLIERILWRKEEERLLNGGVFLWGIGNAVGQSMRKLVKLEAHPEVIFSPIRSAPRRVDVDPENVVVWMAGRTVDGEEYEIPSGSLVTSGYSPHKGHKNHYALVCASQETLGINHAAEVIAFGRLRNILSNRQVGASQVTAVVTQVDQEDGKEGAIYPAAIRAQLIFPYVVQLVDPIPLPDYLRELVAGEQGPGLSFTDLLRQCKNERQSKRHIPRNLTLFNSIR